MLRLLRVFGGRYRMRPRYPEAAAGTLVDADDQPHLAAVRRQRMAPSANQQ